MPPGDERDVYLVMTDFGRLGAAWCEVDENETYREVVIRDLLSGQYDSPLRVIVFNTDQGTSRDVSAEIAAEAREAMVAHRCIGTNCDGHQVRREAPRVRKGQSRHRGGVEGQARDGDQH